MFDSTREPRTERTCGRTLLTLVAAVFVAGGAFAYAHFRGGGGAPKPEQCERISWNTDLPTALAEAQRSGKPVLIDFSAGWCPPCQTMKRDVWTDMEVIGLVRSGYVPVLLDVDQPKGQAASTQYEVQTIPAAIIADENGAALQRGSFMTRDQMLGFLRNGAKRGSP